jgi:hypothetical protein
LRVTFAPKTADSSCLASLARRNDKDLAAAFSVFGIDVCNKSSNDPHSENMKESDGVILAAKEEIYVHSV